MSEEQRVSKAMVCLCVQISYYDISRGVYDLAGRVKVTGAMGVPLCLSNAVDEKSEQENIIYGDDSGACIMLQCGRGELPARILRPGDFQYVHDDHADWVTQVTPCASWPCQNRFCPKWPLPEYHTIAGKYTSASMHKSM